MEASFTFSELISEWAYSLQQWFPGCLNQKHFSTLLLCNNVQATVFVLLTLYVVLVLYVAIVLL